MPLLRDIVPHDSLYNTTYKLYIKMTGKDMVRLFIAHGWRIDRIRGSHHIMVNNWQRAVPIPVHRNRDLPKGLEKAILKQAGIQRSA
jgi:predicted RNA binding protein YcfA (HicA-like mRNA interferase family)